MSKHPRLSLGRTQKRNLFAHVVEDLGTRIIKGDLTPDEPFPIEADLGREFGASRSVIREAVKSLAARGLIESRTRTGIRVMPPIHWNLLDPEVLSWRYSTMAPLQFYDELFEVRLMIEPPAAALAAQRANASDVDEITAAFAEMTRAGRNGSAQVDADLRFHRAILAAGQNALLHQMGHLIAAGLHISHQAARESFTIFLPQHGDVLAAIRTRNPQAARRNMEKLLNETCHFITSHLKAPRKRTR
ncbi:FadR/GntR family transcriptional regulator [Taklimakanibacter lacteus]|uniref:FadR/GntR family transcriptional regulator n=1 Tax=Taklimakanibacter lacteus TaxID=2268456 RepID=UPI000E6691C1